MNTISFLNKSSDMPINAETKRMTLTVPPPGKTEYRIYFDHRIIEAEEDGQAVEVPAADFISVTADSEPTNEEWTTILKEQGYSTKDINKML